jgi:hypothetical protein
MKKWESLAVSFCPEPRDLLLSNPWLEKEGSEYQLVGH